MLASLEKPLHADFFCPSLDFQKEKNSTLIWNMNDSTFPARIPTPFQSQNANKQKNQHFTIILFTKYLEKVSKRPELNTI